MDFFSQEMNQPDEVRCPWRGEREDIDPNAVGFLGKGTTLSEEQASEDGNWTGFAATFSYDTDQTAVRGKY
jgi:hypothetical protein